MIKIGGVGVCALAITLGGTNYGIQSPFFVWEDVAVEFT